MVPKHHKSPEHTAGVRGPEKPRILDEAGVLQALRDVGAVTSGHFILSSGRHSNVYAEKFRALEQPGLAVSLGASLASRFAGRRVDVVLSPALGAIVLGFATALALAPADAPRFIFAERDAGTMRLRRGFAVAPAERVLVVEDVVTTGKSLKEVLALVDPQSLVGVGCLIDRSSGLDLGMPLTALARLDAPNWDPAECPLCADGVPAVAPGSRHLAASSG